MRAALLVCLAVALAATGAAAQAKPPPLPQKGPHVIPGNPPQSEGTIGIAKGAIASVMLQFEPGHTRLVIKGPRTTCAVYGPFEVLSAIQDKIAAHRSTAGVSCSGRVDGPADNRYVGVPLTQLAGNKGFSLEL